MAPAGSSKVSPFAQARNAIVRPITSNYDSRHLCRRICSRNNSIAPGSDSGMFPSIGSYRKLGEKFSSRLRIKCTEPRSTPPFLSIWPVTANLCTPNTSSLNRSSSTAVTCRKSPS